MAPKSIFPGMPLSLDSIKLGRLVLNTRDPQQDYQDPPPTADPPTVTITQAQDFEELRISTRASKFRARLASLLSQSLENKTTAQVDFSAAKSLTYLLNNTTAWFTRACGAAESRQWLEAAIEGGSSVYLVVGYHTLVDARFTQLADSSAVRAVAGGVRVSAGAAGAAAVVDLTTAVDGERESESRFKRSFVTMGEQIYAVQYRKIRFRWFSSRSVGNSFLEPRNRWKVCFDVRGSEEDEGEGDVVEVGVEGEGEEGEEQDEDEGGSESEPEEGEDEGEETDETDRKYVTEDGETEFVF